MSDDDIISSDIEQQSEITYREDRMVSCYVI